MVLLKQPSFADQLVGHYQHAGDVERKVNEAVNELATEKTMKTTQLAIGWVLAKGQHIVPVIGARMRRQLSEALGALQVEISAGDLARIEATISPSVIGGTRYDQNQMRVLDSEKQ